MCGFIINFSISSPVNDVIFNKARDLMYHRGPDAAGTVILNNGHVALGHRRLSIMDLRDSANQPMQLDNLFVTFNGEIYNYPELRKTLEKKGCRFKTHCDAEVLLHGYSIWGDQLCHHLSGMFAFAIWDDEKKSFFLGRDHVGQKPLYYAQIGDQFIAASEIKAIKQLIDKKLTVRYESVVDFQYFDFVPEPYTWYQDINCLLPGHSLKVDKKDNSFSLFFSKYWDFVPDPNPTQISQTDALDLLGEQVTNAVRTHLLSDVEVGAFLSGGVDSSLVVSIASELLSDPIKTFSIGFGSQDGDELPLARETSHHLGTIHTEGFVTEDDYMASLNNLLNVFDQPFADTSLVPTERVSMLAAKNVKVVLTGDGGDEAFGGYDYGQYLSPFLATNKPRKLKSPGDLKHFLFSYLEKLYYLVFGSEKWRNNHNALYRPRSRQRVNQLLGDSLVKQCKEYNPYGVYDQHRQFNIDTFREKQWIGIKVILPNKHLVKVDRSSMQHSLEARAPFLSHTLLETMLNLPTQIKNPEKDWYKGLFRNWAKNKIPYNVLHAPKRGFATPKHWSPLKTYDKSIQPLPLCIDASFVNPASVARIMEQPKLFWKFLQLENALEKGIF